MNHRILPLFLLSFTVPTGALYGQPALSPVEVKNVNATANATVNATLPPAPPTFNLSGALTGSAAFFLAVTAQTTDGSLVFSGSVDPLKNTYLIKVPAGTYQLSVSYIGSLASATSISTFKDPTPVQVNADTVRDIMVAPIITHLVSGTISALDSRFPNLAIIFAPADSTSGFTGSPAKLNADGTYRVQLSDGSYSALLALSSTDSSKTMIVKLGSVTVAGSDVPADFTTPSLANLTGTVRTADLSPIPMGSSVAGIEGNLLVLRNTTGFSFLSFGSGSVDSGTGSYQVVLVDGRTYTIGLSLSLIPESFPQSSGDLTYLLSNPVQMAGDTSLDIALPPIPGTVTISGQVTDSTGASVANAAVTASTSEVTGIPLGGFTRSTQTDSNGNYQLVVFSGTNYDLMFTPPVASPLTQFQTKTNGAAGSASWQKAMQWLTEVRPTPVDVTRSPR